MGVKLVDLATSLGLDSSTVSRALRDDATVHPNTRVRVKAEALRLGYQPHAGARALAEGRSRTYWFLLPTMDTPVEREPASWASKYLLERGYDLLVAQHHNDAGVYARLLARLSSGTADGAIVIPHRGSGNSPEARVLGAGVPLVFLDRHVPGVDAPLMTTDNAGAVADALRLLGPLSWVLDGFVPELNTVEAERSRGLREAASRLGIPVLVGLPGSATRTTRPAGVGALFTTGQQGALDWAPQSSSPSSAVVFDAWTGPVWPFQNVRVLYQDFRSMGETAAEALLAGAGAQVSRQLPLLKVVSM
ncbi:MAG: LacI family DNA-binding transcriptional regulator [Spirochaetales bacterium]